MSLVEQFHLMNLDQRLLSAISDLKWERPTDIQQAVIPLALERKSICVQARTGSGKTGAFSIPIIQSILETKIFQSEQSTSALILAPTRELCSQISKDIKSLCKYASKNVNVFDLAQSDDIDLLGPLLAENPDIVVGTPLKISEQLLRKRLTLDALEHLVIDEADLIFVFGYEKHMQALQTFLPKKSIQVILMSATLDEATFSLRGFFKLSEWVRVELPEENFLPSESQLAQYVISADESSKFAILISMIQLKLIRGRTIIFTNSIDRCYKLKLFLEEFGVKSVVLNSELPVASRCHTVQQFNRGLYDYLLATDENDSEGVTNAPKRDKLLKPVKDAEYGVSRGIDFKLVSNVLNFDFPLTAKRYVHRVGRTARADQMGTAISFVDSSEESQLSEVTNLLSQNEASNPRADQTNKAVSVNLIFRPYQFRLSEVDGFRYRAMDVAGKITRKRIREARLKEIKLELMNSERLKSYFEDHSADMDALRHDKLLSSTQQAHLKNVPEYMVPQTLQALIRGSNQRARDRQRYRPSSWAKGRQRFTGKAKASTSAAGSNAEKPIRMHQLRCHRTKMAIARNPEKVAQIKRQMARKKKAANPLFNFGKKR
ncbi:ATP dependent RNA helicase DDX56 [Echinococcus multilocularis]|uniref:RNA helicase n=1 Tax=Echinococcus multilocularis TaxID=6211 RepID=A0A068YBP7_ECHMU|nr:ATP dependent RNA helicase DDX56 [Echinococcus multilocularis]